MSSIRSWLVQKVIRRQKLFGDGTVDPLTVRRRLERASGPGQPRRGVALSPVVAGGVPAEWLVPREAPADRVLLYIHGGAWFMGSPRTHRALASELAKRSGVRALSVDYRLAPENPYPAGLDDCVAVYEWLLGQGVPARGVVVAGDSAGGNLALALLVALRDHGRPLPAGAVALSPATDLAATGESLKTREPVDPFFAGVDLGPIIRCYTGSHDPRDPLVSPLYADLRDLPPLLLHVGDNEVLLDDTVRFGERAAAAGVEVRTVVWPGMCHVFQTFSPFVPEARRANAEIAEFVRSILGARKPER
jgi:epsilon-lactone hydrolase